MADIQFPNFANALTSGLQARALVDHNAQTQRRRDLAPDVQAAIGGDTGALGRVAAVDPDYAMKIGPILDKLDADKQAVLKRAADFTTQAGMGILNTEPAQRPAAYEAAKAEAARMRIPTENWPQQWDARAEGWLTFNVNKAVPVAKWFEEKEKTRREQPTPIVPGGGGAPPAYAGGNPQDQAAFVQQMMPHAMAISQATGLDPRLVLAQAALETGYGKSAPGNNFFGIKSGGQPGGQRLATTEAGPGGALVPTQDTFRTYPDAGASARDYTDFIKGNGGRYQPVLAAQGLDAQIDAMGKSGYATDPNYGAKLRQIAQTLPMPGMPPQSAAPQIAQAVPPGVIPQGSGGESPTPTTPPQTRDQADPRGRGGVPLGVKGQPVMKDGHQLFLLPDGTQEWYKPPPTPQTEKAIPPTGYRNGANGALEFIPGGPADPTVQERAANAKRAANEKAVPQTVAHGIQTNLDAMKQIDRTLEALKANRDSVGGWGSVTASIVPGAGNLQNRWGDPAGTQLRALVADIGSLKIHDRSGAAVTASEFPRLRPFIPTIADDPATVETKLQNFKAVYEQTIRDTTDYYSQENGFRPYTPATKYLDGTAPPATPAATPQTAPAPKGAADQGRDQFNIRNAPDGATATNPQTGAKMIKRNGNWEALQ